MEDTDLSPLLAKLSRNVSDLEEVLSPLLKQALSEQARQFPVLDRAKLYAHVVYAIESLLFSYLRLHGVKATEHPVFRELTRVKQYFQKIQAAETGPEKPRHELDKAAANRFIKNALASNTKGTPEAPQGDASVAHSSQPEAEVPPKRKFGKDEADEVEPRTPAKGQRSKSSKKDKHRRSSEKKHETG